MEKNWMSLAHKLGKEFEKRAEKHDKEDSFVIENYADLKENGFLAAAIPAELGGGGISHEMMCDILRVLSQYCSSTALALSMHQHLLAANIWKYKQGQGAEEMLRNVAARQPVLVSTGARDWLESSGIMERTDGGYLVSAVKPFASQSVAGDILVTSSVYDDPEAGKQVIHFTVPFKSKGVKTLDDWYTLGMRATGSRTVKLDKVFVPETSVVLKRPHGKFHPVWNVILTVAMPLIMSVYVGIAQKAVTISLKNLKRQKRLKNYSHSLVGMMYNDLRSAEIHLKDMIRITNNFDFKPLDENGNEILIRKTNTANACIRTVEKAMEISGGAGFYRGFGLEKLFRDVQAAKYHPLQEKDQFEFTGEYILKTFDEKEIEVKTDKTQETVNELQKTA